MYIKRCCCQPDNKMLGILQNLYESTCVDNIRQFVKDDNYCTLHRQNAENWKQIFPEKEYRGLSPNFHTHVSVSELYITTMGLPFLLEEICGPILGIYKSLTET